MRPNVFHGTNSIICAKGILPKFMRHLGSAKPVSIAKRRIKIQIFDTHESPATRVNAGLAAGLRQLSWPLLSCGLHSTKLENDS